MDPLLWIVLLRALERLAVVLVGTLAVWMGFRLFVLLPRRREGEARLELPGEISVYVSRIAPGVFFALFGAALIGYSASRPVSYTDALRAFNEPVASGEQQAEAGRRHYLGMGGGVAVAPTDPRMGRMPLEPVLAGLDRALASAGDLDDVTAQLDIEMAIREAKLALLRERWDPAWGPYEVFRAWVVEAAARGEPPSEVAEVGALFLGKAR